MTDQELKDLVASLAISHRKTEKVLRDISKEAERRAQEAERREQEAERREQERAQEADRRLAKLEEQIAETGRHLKNVSEMMGGMSNSQGQIAEEFFYQSLRKHPQVGNLRFDLVYRNWRVGASNGLRLEDEFDLVLVNGDAVALFEVKTKARENVVKTVIDRKIPNLRTLLLPHLGELKIYGGIASLVTYDNLIKAALEHGLFLITQQGEHLEVVNSQVRQF